MKTKLYLIFSIIIVCVSLFLRLRQMDNRAPFDWDQNRDYEVIEKIASGKPTLIGPVAKGEGGFFLGPLYYYLVTPTYLIMQGSPLSLPLTSVLLDGLTVIAILVLLKRVLGSYSALALAAMWGLSWFAIENSRISWNVALVPLWSVLILSFLSESKPFSRLRSLCFGLVMGLSWHIHAALIPLALVLLLFSWRKWMRDYQTFVLVGMGYIIPLIPLILFDLRHSGLNYHLLTQMVRGSGNSSVTFINLVTAIMLRLGKNTQALITGVSSYHLLLGYLTFILAMIGVFVRKGIFSLASLLIVINVLAVYFLGEVGFPEYYLALCYLPTLIILLKLVTKLTHYRPLYLALLVVIIGFLNLRQYTTEETTFALSRKLSLAKHMVSLGAPLDLRFDVAAGREGGILPLYKQLGGKLKSDSYLKVVISDRAEGPILDEGELMTIAGHYGGLVLAYRVVQ